MRLMLHSPIGLLLAEYEPTVLHSLHFWRSGDHPPAGTRDEPAAGDELGKRLVEELREYFAGHRRSFGVPLRPAPTAFQELVREALLRIPYSEVRSYGQLAAEIGRSGASRAVGQANARNPYPLLVPCHRVLATDGRLGGYMGEWGSGPALEKKEWLLRHEGVDPGKIRIAGEEIQNELF